MDKLWDRVQALWSRAAVGEAKTRAQFTIVEADAQTFTPKQHYLQILINEMFLATPRRWFVTYDPLVFVASTYIYGAAQETSPAVVGPSLFQQHGEREEVPQGMIIRNTPVTSLHPYQGGALTLTIEFNRVQRVNNAQNVLNVLENISSVANPVMPAIPFATYLKIAGSVMEGAQTLLNLQETVPLVGSRVTINPAIRQELKPMHIVLIDADERDIDRERFWVIDSRLHAGQSRETAQPYRAHDFVLLQIAQGKRRDDERTLAFYPLWEKTLELAVKASDSRVWNDTKAHFNTLKYELITSPDLTQADYQRLRDTYLQQITQLRHEAVDLASRAGRGELSAEEQELRRIADELDALDEL
jgi:hypothetical protein